MDPELGSVPFSQVCWNSFRRIHFIWVRFSSSVAAEKKWLELIEYNRKTGTVHCNYFLCHREKICPISLHPSLSIYPNWLVKFKKFVNCLWTSFSIILLIFHKKGREAYNCVWYLFASVTATELKNSWNG